MTSETLNNEARIGLSLLNAGLYIAKLEDGVWIAPWSGDPGRTLKKENSKKFKTKRAAYLAIAEAMLFRDFNNPTVEMYNDKA